MIGVTGVRSAVQVGEIHPESSVHRSTLAAAAFASVALPIGSAFAQQSDLSVSPFVSFLPSAGTSPLAGLALTLAGNTGLGLRASGHLALENSNNVSFGAAGTMRPWGADADAMLFLGGRNGFSRTIAPFVFAGIGTGSRDSAGYNIVRNNWSYGAGAAVPLGSAIDLFGEARWRMSRYVLPTASFAPSPTTELRFGVSFHVGGGSSGSSARRGRDRRIDVAPTVSLPSDRAESDADRFDERGSCGRHGGGLHRRSVSLWRDVADRRVRLLGVRAVRVRQAGCAVCRGRRASRRLSAPRSRPIGAPCRPVIS